MSAGASAPPARRLLRLLALLSAAIVGLTAMAILHGVRLQQQEEAASLEVAAGLQARQIADWLGERRNDAGFVQASRFATRSSRDWLRHFGKANHFPGVLLLDDRGEALAEPGGPPGDSVDPALQAAARQAAATDRIAMLGPYRDGAGRLRLDFIAPTRGAGGRPGPVAVLRTDPASYFPSVLQAWPAAGASGETLLFRRDGDQVFFLNDLRHRPESAARLRLPLAQKELLAAQALGGAGAGRLVEGIDYRGVPALGAVRAIPGTDWFLIAKLDRTDFYASVIGDSLWIAPVGLLALFVLTAGAFVFHLRRRLDASQHERAAQAERLQALQLLDILTRNSPDVIFVKDTASRYLFLNEGTARFIGKPTAQVLGRDETALLSPADAAVIMAEDRRVMEENQVISYEDNIMTQVGMTTFLTTKGPVHDAEGRVIGVFGIARDITERKRAEDQVRKLSLAVEQSPASIFITDLQGNIEYVNEAFVRNTGYSREEVLGRKIGLCSSGKTPPETYAALWAALREGLAWEGEFCNRRKDGSEYVDSAIIAPIRQEDGRITHYVAVQEDITEKKRLEEELDRYRHQLELMVAERTEELQAVLDAIPAAVLIAGDPHCRRITGNPAGNRIFSVAQGGNISLDPAAPEPAADYRVFDGIGRELGPEELPLQRAAARGSAIRAAEYRLCFTDGRQVWLYGHASPLFGRDGAVRGVVGVFSDITELKAWEQTLERRVAERTAELQAANKELEGFTYAASHDMKAPLGRINSFSTLLSRQYRDQLQGDGLQMLDLIQQNATRLHTLIEDLLAHAQVGQQPAKLQPVDLAAMMGVVLHEQEEEIRRTGAEIRLDLPAGSALRGDPLGLGQVLRNLVGNALKYSHPARPPVVEIGARIQDGVCRLWVRDNGIGIDKAYQERIFEIFRRLHTYNEYPGTGIGLALVKKAMERMGGRVWVESEPDQGAAFYVELPAWREDAGCPAPEVA